MVEQPLPLELVEPSLEALCSRQADDGRQAGAAGSEVGHSWLSDWSKGVSHLSKRV